MKFLGEEKEDLIRYARTILATDKIDYFIFGHRHLVLSWKLREGSEIIFLGDWVRDGSYAEWDGNELFLREFTQPGKSSTFTATIK
jgi:UDP-2,3-diacylglucosamine hydrolase